MEATSTSIPATTPVVLPAGTMISLSRINWYAVLFYVGMVVAVGSYYWSRYITKRKVMSTPQPLNEDVDVSSR
jgi:prolipoprotein diacylglyceryltransferase